jgi:uncharacterized protein (DUF2249 family)
LGFTSCVWAFDETVNSIKVVSTHNPVKMVQNLLFISISRFDLASVAQGMVWQCAVYRRLEAIEEGFVDYERGEEIRESARMGDTQ